MTIVSGGQVAVFYSLSTGALLRKHVRLPGELNLDVVVPPGMGILIQSITKSYDDESCYALIAANTSFIPNQFTDRCAVMDSSHTVIAIHKRDPAILPAQPGEGSLLLHRYAQVGDVLVPGQGTFQRRYVRVDVHKAVDGTGKRIGNVTGIVLATVDATGVQVPVAASVHEIVRYSLTLNIGNSVDLSRVSFGVAQALAASDAAP